MSDNWVVQNLQNALDTWNKYLSEIWQLITQSPEQFKGGSIWGVIVNIHDAVRAIGLALLVLFFVVGVMRTCGSFAEVKKPEHALKLFIRFAIAKGVVTYGLELMILMPMQGDFRDEYRGEYNQMLLDKATGANGIMQEKYITISVVKKDVEEARAYFSRVGADLISHFAALGSKCVELDATERLRILHDFYRQGEESEFVFNAREMMKRGHSFKDYICPDGIEKNSDYLKLGGKFCRVLFLKDYASYIKDNMVTELTDFNRKADIAHAGTSSPPNTPSPGLVVIRA